MTEKWTKEGKIMTNYEKIMEEMTAEELAELLTGNFSVRNTCLMCAYRNTARCAFHCLDGIEEWLKQEAEVTEE